MDRADAKMKLLRCSHLVQQMQHMEGFDTDSRAVRLSRGRDLPSEVDIESSLSTASDLGGV